MSPAERRRDLAGRTISRRPSRPRHASGMHWECLFSPLSNAAVFRAVSDLRSLAGPLQPPDGNPRRLCSLRLNPGPSLRHQKRQSDSHRPLSGPKFVKHRTRLFPRSPARSRCPSNRPAIDSGPLGSSPPTLFT